MPIRQRPTAVIVESESGCTVTEGTFGARYFVDHEITDDVLVTSISFLLTVVSEQVDPRNVGYAFHLFLDGDQVSIESRDLTCGSREYITLRTPLNGRQPSVVNVVNMRLPLFPDKLSEYSYDEVLQLDPDALYDLKVSADRFTDVDSSRLSPTGASIQKPPAVHTEIVPLDFPVNPHLTVNEEWLSPALLHRLPKDESTLHFNFVYQEESAGPITRTFTCLLNDSQASAFDQSKTITAKLKYNETIRVRGSVEINIPGWHLLHCFKLNSLYTTTIDHDPFMTQNIYVYKE